MELSLLRAEYRKRNVVGIKEIEFDNKKQRMMQVKAFGRNVGALNIMRKVVGDSYVSRIVNSGHSLCPVRYSNPFVRIV